MFDIEVIYKASNDAFEYGYHLIIQEHLNQLDKFRNVAFFREGPWFENRSGQYWAIISSLYRSPYRYMCFSTDDTVIYRRPEINYFHDLQTMLPQRKEEVFSFRIGPNCIMQDIHTGREQPPLTNHEILKWYGEEFVQWDSREYDRLNDFGYPMMFSMNVYKRDYMIKMIEGAPWNNSNELEDYMLRFNNETYIIRTFMRNVAVDTPVNNLSGWNKFGTHYSYSVEYLNEQFIAGKKIDLSAIEQIDIIGAHQEVPFNFIDRNNG